MLVGGNGLRDSTPITKQGGIELVRLSGHEVQSFDALLVLARCCFVPTPYRLIYFTSSLDQWRTGWGQQWIIANRRRSTDIGGVFPVSL